MDFGNGIGRVKLQDMANILANQTFYGLCSRKTVKIFPKEILSFPVSVTFN